MKPNDNNMVMVDFAARDPRSVKASLRGHGDGRADDYDHFAKKAGSSSGMDAVAADYSRMLYLGRRRVAVRRFSVAENVRAIAVAVSGLLLSVMAYQVLFG